MNSGLLLGIEIGGTKLQLALGSGDGRLLARDRQEVRPEAGATGILQQVCSAVCPLAARVGLHLADLDAVGIGFGGPVDAAEGIVIKSHQIEGWEGFPLAAWFRRELGLTHVALQNDADTAGLGEARYGAGAGLSPILYVTVGSGVGGGLVVDGNIYRASGQGAVEIGHLWVDDVRRGERRLLEDVASGWSLGRAGRDAMTQHGEPDRVPELRRLVAGDPERVSGALVAEAARRGDPSAREILGAAQVALAQGLAHAVTLLAPRRIILGGGVSTLGEALWLAPIRAKIAELVFPPFRNTYDLVPASLGEEVVLHGAIGLAADLVAATA
jgi:glucokinase